MGCFLGCFGSSKDRKRRKKRYKVIPRDQYPKVQNLLQADVSLVQSIKDKPSNSLPESRGKNEESLSLSTRKKVTFDTNVTTYEHVQVYDSTESLLERNEKGEMFPKSAETHPDSDSDSGSGSQHGSDVVNAVSYPPNYRYGNCLESDDEVEDSENDDELYDEDDYDDEDAIICQQVWCESIPVPAPESRPESSSLDKVGSNSNARDRSAYVIPVLNPVENLSQWKALKSKETRPTTTAVTGLKLHHQKENSSLNSAPPAVDSSLSNWLVNTPSNKGIGSCNSGIEAVSSGKNSTTTSIEDRPILGALTVEEIKQFSASSSCTPTPPRKSPGRSPDDMPIIGSVGSYWSSTSSSSYKGIPNSTSKYREDKKVNWHNTPFETRLERALNGGVAEA